MYFSQKQTDSDVTHKVDRKKCGCFTLKGTKSLFLRFNADEHITIYFTFFLWTRIN